MTAESSAAGSPPHADLHPPREVVDIARTLSRAGFDTWAVGGAVRDALRGEAPGDWDLATAARPADMRRIFRRTVPIGIEHGTVGVLGRDGKLYEVTTFRRDVETDGRHARVRFADTVDEDLARRDFTINALAWHPLTRELRDPHGGAADLAAGVLRTVDEPAERFREDRLRVLRAFRFAGRFALRVEPATWAAARAAAPELPHLSAERVREELMKVLAQVPRPSDALSLYTASGALAVLYPELAVCADEEDGRSWAHLLRSTDAVPMRAPTRRLAALLHAAGDPRHDGPGDGAASGVRAASARALMRRLKFSNAETDRVTHRIAQQDAIPSADAAEPALRRWLRCIGPAFVEDVLHLRAVCLRGAGADKRALRDLARLRRRARALLASRAALSVADLAIAGADLRRLGLPPGPLYGEILNDLLERVTDEPELNDAETLLEMVRARIG